MTGDGCFAIATDLRYGQELKTVTTDFPKAFEMSSGLWMGLTGLATDVQTVQQKMEFRKQMYELTENRKMKPEVNQNYKRVNMIWNGSTNELVNFLSVELCHMITLNTTI